MPPELPDPSARPEPAAASRRLVLAGGAGLTAASLLPLGAGAAHADPATRRGRARVVGEKRLDARTLDLTIDSPALGTTATVRLLLPPGWTPGRRRTWPVLYLLHGAWDDYTSWTRSTDVAALTEGTGLLVVMPEAGRAGFYSDWWNGGAGGAPRWETFHLGEVRHLLEHGYGAGRARAVAGLSMGGFGAVSYAARHPRMFRAAASFSGVAHPPYTGPHEPSPYDGPRFVSMILESNGFDPSALWGDPVEQAEVWAAHSPVDLAARLARVPVVVSSGNGQPGPLDAPGTPADRDVEPLCELMSQTLVTRLRQEGADLTARLYGPGTHTWPYWERELHAAFPLLVDAVGATRA
ncbi:alpha/beta hydrolase [Streptomyces sp. 4N509B]|uniref:alpha/beta hydrolase n=1 Tax=Streptomyces sp. 4N509B TaxID=3457413 RepID=UPI003FD0EFDA